MSDWWICDTCGFDAKKFEPREEKQRDAMRWHIALLRCLKGTKYDEARAERAFAKLQSEGT